MHRLNHQADVGCEQIIHLVTLKETRLPFDPSELINLPMVIHTIAEYHERYHPQSRSRKNATAAHVQVLISYHIEISISTGPIGDAGECVGRQEIFRFWMDEIDAILIYCN
jgi:hypothetical protein